MSKKDENKKVPLLIRIDPDLDKELRRKILERYGEYRKGYLSRAVEEALWLWVLSEHTHTNTGPRTDLINKDSEHGGVKPSRTVRTVMAIVMKLAEREEITSRELKAIIAEVAGADPRTLRKYEDLLYKVYKIIIPTDAVMRPGGRIIIYRVNSEKVEEFMERYGGPLADETRGHERGKYMVI